MREVKTFLRLYKYAIIAALCAILLTIGAIASTNYEMQQQDSNDLSTIKPKATQNIQIVNDLALIKPKATQNIKIVYEPHITSTKETAVDSGSREFNSQDSEGAVTINYEATQTPMQASVDALTEAPETIPAITTRFRSLSTSVQKTQSSSASKNTKETSKTEQSLPYLIYVSKDSFTIAILEKDENGEYTQLVRTYHTAIGRSSAQTRAGTYKIIGRERWHTWKGGSYSPYTTRHSGGLYFHGPIYSAKDSYSLNAESYNQIGTKASAGCMRTYTSAAAWIYYNCPTGTPVIVANDSKYSSSPPTPIDTSQKYDPTDPDVIIEMPTQEQPELELPFDYMETSTSEPPTNP